MIGLVTAAINMLRVSLLAGVSVDWSNRFFGMPVIRKEKGSTLTLGNGLIALSKPRYNEIGVSQPVVISLMSATARITLGNHVGLSGCTLSARTSLEIGDGTQIGSGALIMDHDAHALPLPDEGREPASRPVRIGKHVFIGARAIILKGVTIGDQAVIGAGAVIVHDVPAGCVAAGNPARIIRQRGEEKK